MELILFRHGLAAEGGPSLSDAARPLTDKGIRRTAKAARGLARLVDRPDVIVTSPKTRAMQTAALAAEVFDLAPEACEALGEGPATAVLQAMAHRVEQRILLVGHEPWMSELIERVCLGRATGTVELKKAGAAMLHLGEAGQGTLRWLVPPKVLRAMA